MGTMSQVPLVPQGIEAFGVLGLLLASPNCHQKLRHQLPSTPVAAGGGEIEQPQGAAAGEWGGICVLSKQQPQCPVAASSLINQPQPNVLAFPPPQGDWGWARVPRGVRWGWVGGVVGWCLASHPWASILSSPGSSQLFMSWNDSLLAPTIMRASATNHLWGSAGRG